MKLLLHTCCAPCLIQCAEALAEEGIKPDLFWYNPNIHPLTEYRSRLEALTSFLGGAFAEEKKLSLIGEDNYGLRFFLSETFPFIEVPGENSGKKKDSRCHLCYKMRLEKTAALAAEKGYQAFSTTLLISPFQNHEQISRLGRDLASGHNSDSPADSPAKSPLEFFYRDFRPRFRESQRQARALGFYMQKYCGCIFSEEERWPERNK